MTEADQPPGRAPLPPPRVGTESVLDQAPSAHGALASGVGLVTPDHAQHAPDNGFDSAAAPTGGEPVVIGSAQPLAVGVGDSGRTVAGGGSIAAGGRARIGDKVFAGFSAGAAGLIVAMVVLIAAFLLIKSVPSILDDKVNFLTSREWSTTPGNLRFGVADLLWVTIAISVIAMILAVPVAIGIALFVTNYAPSRLAKPIAYIIDLLAAIPSIVYGIWGAVTLAPALEGVQRALSGIPGPLFDLRRSQFTIFDGGVVLAVMILPIVTAISRDVFERTPRANIEAALALGATKWEMIRIAVLPYGRAGVTSGAMLGLGRALGETVAVYLIVHQESQFTFSIFSGGETFASRIANGSAEFNNPSSTGAYIAAGLMLFVLTFVVNSAARYIVNRGKVD
jgi:phosphate transport system permease protein